MAAERPYDVAVFGATGFTGELTAQYLAANAPAGTRWALAGRNASKLDAVRGRLAETNPACAELDLLHADIGDADSIREVAEKARVVITTVGPYITYGEPLVAACAEAGTDYVDLTGEPEFVDLMYVRHHARAAETGARIVHACGFDSIPHDLGAYFTVKQLPDGAPLTVEGFVRANGTFSGGTLHSAVTGFSRVREWRRIASERKAREPKPSDRRVRGIRGGPKRAPSGGGWALPMPTIDPQVVCRSARAIDLYGPDFSYGHYIVVKHLPTAVGLPLGLAGVFAMAQLPPTRNWLLNRRQPGEGPSAEQRAKGWFKVRFVGEGGGKRVVTEVAGGDPGYGETAKMLAESALCLAGDELPETAGQVTTAAAMGDALTARLERAGISFSVLEG
jgi:short subunit dehydrogenase-like uncharacterized protein